jgi:heat shock protein HslJ
MKWKLIAIISVALILASKALTACTSSNDVPPSVETEDARTLKEKLLGSWTTEKIRVQAEWFNISSQVENIETITFEHDGSFSGSGSHLGGSGNYSISDSTLELKDVNGTLIHTYVIKGIDSQYMEIKVTSCTDKHRFILKKK